MKRMLLLLGALVLASAAWGQINASTLPVDEQAVERTRARIELERHEQTKLLAEEDDACLSRFAVTRCQNGVAQRRRVVLARLKREEVALNDAMRRERARIQVQRTQEKNDAEAAQRVGGAASPPADDRQQKLDEKVANHPKPASSTATGPTVKTISPVDAKVLEESRNAYQDKLKAAQTQRLERDKRLQEKGPAKATLPVPP